MLITLPSAPRDHIRKRGLRHMKHGFEIDGLHLVPLLLGHVQKRLPWIHSSVVHEHIDGAKLAASRLNSRINCRTFPQIERNIEHLSL
jgi:hypothetical protein